ncbi:class I SAM-dependent methyltransferase [Ktedonosporobacter rubrisoli]|uniref:class I SAM-dependent methyltransferase n=1 Tax=Ktedonosporobacter rubrisoli TaxID=2509675 RepID=UPI001F5E0B58|nr:class I SAM-dependent methyltransferase [Ktedonosporobacter rubrisoli]
MWPGEWALGLGKLLPACQVTGIDISRIMISYAKISVQEREQGNVNFHVMDVHQPLAFPDASFDLIHARFLVALMRTTDWPALLKECLRLLRPGGILCCVEGDNAGLSNSPALQQRQLLMTNAMRQAGYCFSPLGISFGLLAAQPRLLKQAGFERLEQQAYVLNCSAGTPAHESACDNWRTMLKLVDPFLLRQGVATQEELDLLYEQAMQEIYEPDFDCVSLIQRLWGYKPALS